MEAPEGVVLSPYVSLPTTLQLLLFLFPPYRLVHLEHTLRPNVSKLEGALEKSAQLALEQPHDSSTAAEDKKSSG